MLCLLSVVSLFSFVSLTIYIRHAKCNIRSKALTESIFKKNASRRPSFCILHAFYTYYYTRVICTEICSPKENKRSIISLVVRTTVYSLSFGDRYLLNMILLLFITEY